jgi:hypothetical protein
MISFKNTTDYLAHNYLANSNILARPTTPRGLKRIVLTRYNRASAGNSTSFLSYRSMFWNFGLGYSSTSQFRCYLQQISTINNLRYYFDAKRAGVTEDYVKNTFKQMMYNEATKALTPNGELVFDAIWGNTRGLRVDLFQNETVKIEAQKVFIKDFASNTNSKFYSFINVK